MEREPSHAICYREQTDDEASLLADESSPSDRDVVFLAASGLVVGVILGGFAGGLLALGFRWVVAHDGVEPFPLVEIALVLASVLAGLVLGSLPAREYRRHMSRNCMRAREDLVSGVVQILHVRGGRVVVKEPYNDEGRALIFDVGDGWLLLLQGDWLYDESTYGAPARSLDEVEAADDTGHINGVPDPHGFPSGDFELDRAERSGIIFGIRVRGPYLEPCRTAGWKEIKPGLDDAMSVLVPGDLGQIAAAFREPRAEYRKPSWSLDEEW